MVTGGEFFNPELIPVIGCIGSFMLCCMVAAIVAGKKKNGGEEDND